MRSTTPRGNAAFLLPAALFALAGMPGVAEAVTTVSINAASFQAPMPDGSSLTMWGFGTGASDAPTVPGPAIVVPAGETVLDVTLKNNLSVPVSFVILGQPAPTTGGATPPGPTFVDSTGAIVGTGSRPAGSPGARIRSFTEETPPGGTVTYRFSGIRPGTYLYESGTHQAVQVQMGLYGAMKLNAADAVTGPPAVLPQAYAGVPYDAELTLLYSEVDPALHAAVAGGTYGTPAYPSTFAYEPRFFLVNGAAFAAGPPAPAPLPAGNANGTTLLRLLNAGLRTHVPTLLGGTLRLVAEDGNAYAHETQGYSVPLPAGKTADAIFTAPAAGSYPLFDRALALMNGTAPDGGMRSVLAVGGSVGPTAAPDTYATAEDTPLSVPAAGVLANDGTGLTAALATGTSHGSVTLLSDGSFTYAPATNFNGTDSFTYRAFAGTAQSAPATVTISVTPVNDTPIAVANSYSGTAGVQLAVGSAAGASPQGVLLNDFDADGNALTAALASGPSGGTLALRPNGSFTFTAASAGTYTFSYTASDGTASSASALVTITVAAPVNKSPVAVDDGASTTRNGTVTITVLANDYDTDGTLNAASVAIVTAPLHGTTTVLADGRIRYVNRSWKGTDTFSYRVRDNLNALSNVATVRVNVK
jgi:FtsP/CotA-like multicopper oxidase with cupredoxin domain